MSKKLMEKGIHMVKNLNLELSADYAETYGNSNTHMPAKVLLLAILERALLDLFIDSNDRYNVQHKWNAIGWILSDTYELENGFSFLQIIQYLDLGGATVNKITSLAKSIAHKKGKYYELYTRYRSRGYRCLCHLI